MPQCGKPCAISAATVFDGERFLHDHCVIVEGQTVAQLLPAADCPAGLDKLELATGTLAPGLIDLQVNGGGDLLFNNAPCEATINSIHAAHRASGTTAILPTLLSDTPGKQQQAVAAVRAAQAGGNPGILGIHLEGPYFETARRGAHREDMIRPATADDIDWLCSLHDLRVILTLAPEHVAPGMIARLADSGIQVCAGHSNASYESVRQAADQGLRGVTHLFNAMSPLASREPGVVGAALEDDRLWASLIADGHHVHPASIRLAHGSKPAGRLVLVSDAMATVGGRSDSFELYGERIREVDGRLINGAGVLAGSAIGMIEAVAYCSTVVGLALDECLRMASLYPAAILGVDNTLGRIAAGYRADLVHFDTNFAVRNTWLAGERQQHQVTG